MWQSSFVIRPFLFPSPVYHQLRSMENQSLDGIAEAGGRIYKNNSNYVKNETENYTAAAAGVRNVGSKARWSKATRKITGTRV